MNEKVVVTGANGFIGSHLVQLLIKKGYDVHCLVRYTSDVSALRGLNISLHVGDTRQIETLAEPFNGAKYIFHLAAKLLVTTKHDFDETNVVGTKNVFEAANQHAKDTLERLVFVSSLAAMGPNKTPVPYVETDEPHPISWYGESKKKCEEIAHSYFNKIPITIVRPAIVYGEREQDLSQTFPVVEYRIQPKLGLTQKLSNAIYGGDLVEGFVAAAESKNAIGQTYFLNNAELLTSKSIVKKIGIAMNKGAGLSVAVPDFMVKAAAPFAELEYHFNGKRPKMTKDKALEVTQKNWLADPSKAERDFGWVAKHNMVEGLRKTLVPYFAQKKTLRDMSNDSNSVLWIKYFVIGLVMGCLVEALAHLAKFYEFTPSWLIFAIIIGAFGLLFGSLAKALRKQSSLVQFIVGALSAGSIELINKLGIIHDYYWVFAPGWPLGITNPWIRTAVLGLPGGLFILILNYLMSMSYKAQLSVNGDIK
jgi:nucleoside-diphosphate-sugar epimerase